MRAEIGSYSFFPLFGYHLPAFLWRITPFPTGFDFGGMVKVSCQEDALSLEFEFWVMGYMDWQWLALTPPGPGALKKLLISSCLPDPWSCPGPWTLRSRALLVSLRICELSHILTINVRFSLCLSLPPSLFLSLFNFKIAKDSFSCFYSKISTNRAVVIRTDQT